jgi:hypothetical protein
MKKNYLFLLTFLLMALIVNAQDWVVYDADSLPDKDPFNFSTSNVAGTDQHTNTILVDPDNPDNNLLELISPEADPGKFMWKYSFPNDVVDPVTLVARIKGASDTLDRTMEFDIQNAGFRERLYIKNDNTFELKEGGIKGDLPGSALAWHIYRLTKAGDQISFYLDENPEPIATVTTTTSSSENYFRLGDGNGSSTLGGIIDWIIWDTTGAYAPGDGAALPDTLVKDVQQWNVYPANVLPDASEFGMSTSNVGGDQYTNIIIADPDNAGNNLLEMISPQEDPGKFMWKYSRSGDVNEPITFIARVKGASDTLDRTMEFDIQTAGFRERLYIKNDNTFELKESGVKGNMSGGPLQWHIYRITKDGDALTFYLDENPEPVATVTTSTTSGENYFRFGDGNGSSTLGGLVDWIIWDNTGTYAPGEGMPLPDSLVTDVQSWIVYPANVLPDVSEFGMTSSNVGGDQYTNTIIEDDENAGNNLLEMISPQADPGKFMWKYTLPNDVNAPITLVARIQGASDTLDRTMEIDLQQAGFRERLYIKNDNSFELKESSVKADLTAGTMGWHIYRITKAGDQVSFYLDENPQPIAAVTTTTSSGENYFRFGDGNGGSTLGGIIDWIIWDTTGAYAPDVSPVIPDSLLTVTSSSDASLSSLTPGTGALVPDFNPDSLDYTLEVPAGTNEVRFITETTDANASVGGDTLLAAVPGIAVLTVTAEDGYTMDYTIEITVGITPPSDDASLSSIIITPPGTEIPDFDPEILSYDIEVPFGTTSVTVEATATDANASITGTGEVTGLPTTATVTVTAEAGNTQDYDINITVAPDALDEMLTDGIVIYPNPADREVYLINAGAGTLEIYNSVGTKMDEYILFGSPIQSIDVSNLAPGLYFIRLNDTTKQVLIQ